MGVGRGKLLLFGEHAAVYGYPAVGIGTEDFALVRHVSEKEAQQRSCVPVTYGQTTVHVAGLDSRYRSAVEQLCAAYHRIALETRREPDAEREHRHTRGRKTGDSEEDRSRTTTALHLPPLEPIPSPLFVEANIPPACGFGSSAAVCVALARAALEEWNVPRGSPEEREHTHPESGPQRDSGLGHGPARAPEGRAAGPPSGSAEEVWELANRLERVFHGTPSGIDTGLALFGGVQAFEPRPPELPRRHSLNPPALWIVRDAVPRKGNTAQLVAHIARERRRAESETASMLRELGDIAHAAIELLTAEGSAGGGIRELARLTGAAHRLLRRLGLSTPELDARLEAALRAGALGGKLSGAGGGGAYFVLCEDTRSADRAYRALADQGARPPALRKVPLG